MYPLCHILMKLEFSRHFQKNFKYEMLRKSVQWEPSCFMRTDGRVDREPDRQTDVSELIFCFRSFENAFKNHALYEIYTDT